jgi:predicted nuclease with TOPRIM domain
VKKFNEFIKVIFLSNKLQSQEEYKKNAKEKK